MVADKSGPLPNVLRAATRKEVAWKNGGGVTSEIAAFPAGSSIDNFGWRISTALVTAAGPFSIFEGIDRNLTVLEGRLLLRFAADGSEIVLGWGQRHCFAGDVAVEGVPLDGPVRDLNVMVRRGEWQAEVATARPQSFADETLIAIATQPSRGFATLDAVFVAPDTEIASDFVGLFVHLRPATESRR